MQRSWVETVNDYFKDQPEWIIDVGVFGGGFLAIGLLLKSFGKYILLGLLAIIALLVVLHYTGAMPLDVDRMKDFMGLHGVMTFNEGLAVFSAWMRAHPLACVSAVVGFLIGWKLG